VIPKSGAIAKRVVIIWNLCGRSGIRYIFNLFFRMISDLKRRYDLDRE
jgi:hypothetical protein